MRVSLFIVSQSLNYKDVLFITTLAVFITTLAVLIVL